MKNVNLTEDTMADIFNSKVWKDSGFKLATKDPQKESKIDESTEEVNEGDEEEVHTCPLCESHLEEPLSEERIQEHVDYLFSVINEAFETDETLEEEEDAEQAAE